MDPKQKKTRAPNFFWKFSTNKQTEYTLKNRKIFKERKKNHWGNRFTSCQAFFFFFVFVLIEQMLPIDNFIIIIINLGSSLDVYPTKKKKTKKRLGYRPEFYPFSLGISFFLFIFATNFREASKRKIAHCLLLLLLIYLLACKQKVQWKKVLQFYSLKKIFCYAKIIT